MPHIPYISILKNVLGYIDTENYSFGELGDLSHTYSYLTEEEKEVANYLANTGNVEKLHIDDVINLYNEIYEHVPKKVFLARWYPSALR